MQEIQRVKNELYRLFQIEASDEEVAQILRAFYDITFKADSARIADAVCATFGVEMDDLRGKSRERPLPTARKVFCYLCVVHAGLDEYETAKIINRHRSTVYVHVMEVQNDWMLRPKDAKLLNDAALMCGLPKQLTIVNRHVEL
jgi:chromosomal replication initiation ATPase DnaA